MSVADDFQAPPTPAGIEGWVAMLPTDARKLVLKAAAAPVDVWGNKDILERIIRNGGPEVTDSTVRRWREKVRRLNVAD